MNVGTWKECINPMRKPVNHYFKKKPLYKYDFCELCLYEIQKRNGTLPIIQSTKPKNHRPDSKPGKDTL